ncbi:phosphoenolpyruvate--protein phosphotransferase [Ectothiorhodospiraceae bacterium WFHF3C12]|nr:phosphoenolpyruvate--protein phosphotransferase [Ectothiorhodospiraceae bacterium WFHF3C12]
MLETLHRIVQEVNAAADLPHALNIIVNRVAEATGADVASVYLRTPEDGTLALMATVGLKESAVGRVRLKPDEGLVGLVAERAEPMNLENADRHPRFRYFPETGEERFHSFLGVPIIHYRNLLGVLVVQQQTHRRFEEDDVAFLVTMGAQLAGVIAHAQASGDIERLHRRASRASRPLRGVPGARGVAIGTARVVYAPTELNAVPDRKAENPHFEEEVFLAAVQAVREEIKELADRLDGALPAAEQAVFEAYQRILDSNSLIQDTLERIRAGSWAAGAVRETINAHVRTFDEMEDAYLRERAADIRDIGRRILMRMQLVGSDTREVPEHAILVGQEVNASQLAEIPQERLAGVVSARGSRNSHVAILARALGIPAVMGVTELDPARLDGRELITDGYIGRVYVEPARTVRREYKRLMREEAELSEGLKQLQPLPAETTDGYRVGLYANTGLISDVGSSIESGCDGVGLHRTEFPFMIREHFPGELEQARLYREVIAAFAPRPVTLRTLDIGGDKALPYFPIKEDNPFLGWRGIRMTLDHPEIFLTQLRAMLRADIGFGNLRVMFPMVSRLEEVDEALKLLKRAQQELEEDGLEINAPKVGVMIEVPAAVYQVDSLAKRLDFLSIGSNDLAQYLLAVDRNNPRVASLYDELHPAVLRAVNAIAKAGLRHRKPVSVCGSMAGDPGTALLLMAMGIHGLSMSSANLLRVKWVIRSFSSTEAQSLLQQALAMEYPDDVRELIAHALEQAGLGSLIRAGK